MGANIYRMKLETTTFVLDEEPTKRRKKSDVPPSLTVEVPTLVNTRAIARGEVLVLSDPRCAMAMQAQQQDPGQE